MDGVDASVRWEFADSALSVVVGRGAFREGAADGHDGRDRVVFEVYYRTVYGTGVREEGTAGRGDGSAGGEEEELIPSLALIGICITKSFGDFSFVSWYTCS